MVATIIGVVIFVLLMSFALCRISAMASDYGQFAAETIRQAYQERFEDE